MTIGIPSFRQRIRTVWSFDQGATTRKWLGQDFHLSLSDVSRCPEAQSHPSYYTKSLLAY